MRWARFSVSRSKNDLLSQARANPNRDTHNLRKGQLRATDLVIYGIEKGDSYPMPDEATWETYVDLPDSVGFDEADWINVSKSYLAKHFGVAASQVSRWITAGLPVRADGRVDLWRAEHWHAEYEKGNRRRQRQGWHAVEKGERSQ